MKGTITVYEKQKVICLFSVLLVVFFSTVISNIQVSVYDDIVYPEDLIQNKEHMATFLEGLVEELGEERLANLEQSRQKAP